MSADQIRSVPGEKIDAKLHRPGDVPEQPTIFLRCFRLTFFAPASWCALSVWLDKDQVTQWGRRCR
jgi:hypothetical protein